MQKRTLSALKTAIFMMALAPFVRLVVAAFTDALGANPIETITRSTGSWALYLLCVTLAITPLRRMTGWTWLVRMRRMLGLFVFFYALMHAFAFFWFDHFFDLHEMWRDVLKRPFITVGFIAFLLLIPLAATSNQFAISALGGKGWQRLHRLIYLIAALAVLHFWWMRAGKSDFLEPIVFTAVLALLLGVRLVGARTARKARA